MPSHYDAAIEALSAVDRPYSRFEDLHRVFVEVGGSPTKSAYPLRVVLRFLRQLHPPLVSGPRGTYSLTTSPEELKKQAQEAWEKLADR